MHVKSNPFRRSRLSIAAQLLGQGTLRASFEPVLQLRQADNAHGALVIDAHEFAPCVPLHRHSGYHRNPHARSNHGKDGGKLPALEDHVRTDARSAAGRNCIFPEAMTFLEQKKWVLPDFAERQRFAVREAMGLWESGKEWFAEKLLGNQFLAA